LAELAGSARPAQEFGLIDHFDAELPGFLEFAAGFGAGDYEGRLFAHTASNLAPC
jgi:hypothetical protein